MIVRVGLVGYSLGGSVFHAPFIRRTERLQLDAVATSRIVELPGVRAERDPQALVRDPDLDLIVISSPNATHFPLAQAALEHGKHVVIDKPFTVTVAEADALIALAERQQRLLVPFHNRRWDGDYQTVRRLVDSGRLGDVKLFLGIWDRFRPALREGWRESEKGGGGLLNDLGTHLIDQALQLFGWPDSISADVAAQRADGSVEDYFELALHYGARRVILATSSFAAQPRPRFAVYGDAGSFVKSGLDPQEAALKAGATPDDPGFGEEEPEQFGTFTAPDGAQERIPTAPGCYARFYESVADAILNGGPPPVEARDARDGLHIIALARQSARDGRRLPATRA